MYVYSYTQKMGGALYNLKQEGAVPSQRGANKTGAGCHALPGSACVRTAIKEDAINPYMRREPFPVHCFRVLFRRHVKPFEISMRHRKCRFISTIAMRSVVISSTRYCRRTSGLEWPIMFASLVQTTTRFRRRRYYSFF